MKISEVHLRHCFANFNVLRDLMDILLKAPDSLCLGIDLILGISSMFLGNTNAMGCPLSSKDLDGMCKKNLKLYIHVHFTVLLGY